MIQKNAKKVMDAAQAVGRVALTSTQEIAQLNQQASQELSTRLQAKVADLMKTQDPKAAFEFVHAQVLQDAAKEVTQYQAKLCQALASSNQELVKIAESMIKESQQDLIHFVNEATQNAPAGSEPYHSIFKGSFSSALQNFELIRAAMADSFGSFEKSVQNMSNIAGTQKDANPKARSKK
ncbi:hypothetical protein TUM22923_03430 [Polynucleobacter sp. TUM22923]|jgi:superoxide dismutase|uniref:phasin family protein n=1 Tax=Polynucleobacter sp. TUM22923 TaxID=3022126 RepID=UPI002572530E|nr:phasin family protein [Polynucleobacter sp. TUM22923]BDX21022.1 hypothetical protein TUM22923_03430 [Polynucleobacter sp. TUM22923]